ncbi:MAG: flagellar protein FlaG [Syntrophales bacterium]|nr:flagellar protein FlaG [Syntrophales bacterium]
MKVEPADLISTFMLGKETLTLTTSGKENNTSQHGMTSASKNEISRLVEKMQTYLQNMNISINFTTYGEKNERIAILVVEKETGKVIREIPPEELQRLYQRMCELSGLLYNGKI